jgi:hypothetical protein
MTIIEALNDPLLLGSALKDKASFKAWFAALKAMFGLPMTEQDAAIYRACTGRSELPGSAFSIVWLVIGRRGGKSLTMALVATYMALFRDWRPFLAAGERAVVLLVAADRGQAKILRRYIGGIFSAPIFARQVESQTADSIELQGHVVIEVATCSYRMVWRAIRPSMASFGSSALAGSPLLNSGRVELLDNSRLISQLCNLERRTARGGRDSIDHPPGQR